MTLVYSDERRLWYRDVGDDVSILAERATYRPMIMGPGDVVLDIGAHIGVFAAQALDAGVSRLICVEPEFDNQVILRKNVALRRPDDTVILQGAASADHADTITLWRHYRTGWAHTTVEPKAKVRSRTAYPVAAFNFEEMVNEYRPTVIKMDIEGGEYDLMDSLPVLPPWVVEVALEFHYGRKDWRRTRAPAIVARMKEQGFAEIRPTLITDVNWHSVPIWRRR